MLSTAGSKSLLHTHMLAHTCCRQVSTHVTQVWCMQVSAMGQILTEVACIEASYLVLGSLHHLLADHRMKTLQTRSCHISAFASKPLTYADNGAVDQPLTTLRGQAQRRDEPTAVCWVLTSSQSELHFKFAIKQGCERRLL